MGRQHDAACLRDGTGELLIGRPAGRLERPAQRARRDRLDLRRRHDDGLLRAAQGCGARDARDAGLGERVAEDALHHGPGERQGRTDDHGEDDAGEADVPQHLVGERVGGLTPVEAQAAEDRSGDFERGNVVGADARGDEGHGAEGDGEDGALGRVCRAVDLSPRHAADVATRDRLAHYP